MNCHTSVESIFEKFTASPVQQDREQNDHKRLYCLITTYVDYTHDRVNKKHLARFSIVQFSLVTFELINSLLNTE